MQLFEQKFYDEFAEKCPMPEQELKAIYKQVKNEAMALFDKTSVGEVKAEFIG